MPRIFRDDDGEKKPRQDDEERPRLSWSEIDKRKDRSRHAAEDKKPQSGRPPRAASAYNKYKSELNRLFDSGGLASKFKEELGEPSKEAGERTARLRSLKEASGREFEKLLAEYRRDFGMPGDALVLSRTLACGDKAVIKEAVGMLLTMAAVEKIPGKASLAERLRTIELTVDDPELYRLISELKKALGF